jgi:Holliday junction resolvase RusA-like endonuclease
MPAPRPRFRVIQPRGGGRAIASAYNPKEYTDWSNKLAELMRERLGEDPSIEGPVTVGLIVTVQRPKTSKLDAPKPDVDNYAKAILDAMTKASVWQDDTQVVFLAVKKQWGLRGAIDIEVTPGSPI